LTGVHSSDGKAARRTSCRAEFPRCSARRASTFRFRQIQRDGNVSGAMIGSNCSRNPIAVAENERGRATVIARLDHGSLATSFSGSFRSSTPARRRQIASRLFNSALFSSGMSDSSPLHRACNCVFSARMKAACAFPRTVRTKCRNPTVVALEMPDVTDPLVQHKSLPRTSSRISNPSAECPERVRAFTQAMISVIEVQTECHSRRWPNRDRSCFRGRSASASAQRG